MKFSEAEWLDWMHFWGPRQKCQNRTELSRWKLQAMVWAIIIITHQWLGKIKEWIGNCAKRPKLKKMRLSSINNIHAVWAICYIMGQRGFQVGLSLRIFHLSELSMHHILGRHPLSEQLFLAGYSLGWFWIDFLVVVGILSLWFRGNTVAVFHTLLILTLNMFQK